MARAIQFRCAAKTDRGLVRELNEDNYLFGNLGGDSSRGSTGEWSYTAEDAGPLIIACDGMGGAEGGEVASELAANSLWKEMSAAPTTAETAVYARLLRRSMRTANQLVYQHGRENDLRGMGTTVSAAGVVGDLMVLGQVGDSRVYVQRGDVLAQVTRNQSVVSALLSAGQITQEQAQDSNHKSLILQALGTAEDVEVALAIVELRRGDRVMICTDGLHGVVDDEELASILAESEDNKETVDALVEAARHRGGPDNITVVVASFDGEGLRPPLSVDDLPRFTEFNPMEEGSRAFTTTSYVGRRLARRAGIGAGTIPPGIPATGKFPAIADDEPIATLDPTAPPTPSAWEFWRWIIVALRVYCHCVDSLALVKVVVDHIRGKRAGQREQFLSAARLSLGRHPDNDVSFDPQRDLGSSSRHAELTREGRGMVLRDVGSSNGTFVDGERVEEVQLISETPVVVELGQGGPVIRVWIGPDDVEPSLVEVDVPTRMPRWIVIVVAILVLVAMGVVVLRGSP